MRQRDPLALFEPVFHTAPLQSWADEADLATGPKGVFWVTCGDDDPDQPARFRALAEERGLVVVITPVRGLRTLSMHACRPDEVWRAHAHDALLDRVFWEGAWSSKCEGLKSHLLGYTDEQIDGGFAQ